MLREKLMLRRLADAQRHMCLSELQLHRILPNLGYFIAANGVAFMRHGERAAVHSEESDASLGIA